MPTPTQTYYAKNRAAVLRKVKAYYHRNRRARLAYAKIYLCRPEVVTRNRVRARRVAESQPWRWLVQGARKRAIEKSLPFDLTLAWGRKRWTGRCEMSGVSFVRSTGGGGPGMLSPSLDRIDPTRGYTKKNSRFICAGLNSLRSRNTDEQMWALMRAALKFHNG